MLLGFDMSLATGFSFKNLILYVLFLFLVVRKAVNRSQENILSIKIIYILFITLIILALFSWILASLGWVVPNFDKWKSAIAVKNQLIDHILFFYIFYSMCKNTDDALFVAKGILLLIIAGNLITIIDALNIPDLGIIHQRIDGRVNGPLGESNQYAAFLILFIPSMTVFAMQRGVARLLYIAGLILSVAVLFLTTSRGAVVGVVAGATLATIYVRRFISAKQVLVALVLGAVIFGVGLTLATYKYEGLIENRFINQSFTGSIKTASSGRTWIWEKALDLQAEYPVTFLTGFGWESFDDVFKLASHNTYLSLIFSLGIPGLLVFLALLYQICSLTRQGISYAQEKIPRQLMLAFLYGFIPMLVAIFFVNLYKPWFFIWSYVGLIARIAVEQIKVKGEGIGVRGGNSNQLAIFS